MSELYLHKYKKDYLRTSKSTVIADLDKINKNYIYEESKWKKVPKNLIITGQKNKSFPYYTKIVGLPVKKVIIDCNIHDHSLPLCAFDNVKELEIADNVKNIEINNNYGLKDLENITIPFTIESFNNNFIYVNYLKTLIIKYKELTHIIKLDDVFKEKRVDISISNTNNILNIYIEGHFSEVTYQVYLSNDELVSTKKYSRYEIIPNDNDTVLDLIELRKNIDAIFTSSEILSYEKIILSKKDYNFLTNMCGRISKLKEIIIKDENDMSLLPRSVCIKKDTASMHFNHIENYDNNLMFMTDYSFFGYIKFIIVNEDLSVFKFGNANAPLYTSIIDKVIFDFNACKISVINNDRCYTITVPFNKYKTINDYKILGELLRLSRNITVKNNNNEINIPKYIYNNDFLISNIKRYDNDDFGVLYDEIINGAVRKHSESIIYSYDEVTDSYKMDKSVREPYPVPNDYIYKKTMSRALPGPKF